ncbi:PREDICTED: uncharacterized protein LOC106150106 isoform X2 [Chinchilla lanigera]|uniref:uncharacterized protein LOC106150106 isoform X2 n=1 Tax=Chinchilla lanigera TaxID=34839 RepID=UPI000696BA9F|nr:PREDICTED: uncharacterized protein LOC106150106 isoform X2 [Chinchilla lanigera]
MRAAQKQCSIRWLSFHELLDLGIRGSCCGIAQPPQPLTPAACQTRQDRICWRWITERRRGTRLRPVSGGAGGGQGPGAKARALQNTLGPTVQVSRSLGQCCPPSLLTAHVRPADSRTRPPAPPWGHLCPALPLTHTHTTTSCLASVFPSASHTPPFSTGAALTTANMPAPLSEMQQGQCTALSTKVGLRPWPQPRSASPGLQTASLFTDSGSGQSH